MMSSSNPRNTPNLAVPPTQSTAPVIKFRCLFTHDLRRKAKRWHDGFLRFHTFNRRVMVYDSSSNFIGDLHWRETDEVQDGDEMELDKGVLVQVGEPIGRTETDLTPIFEKRKQDQASSPSKEPSKPQPYQTPKPRITSHSQQRDTSLSAILGIKRTPIADLVPTRNHSTASDPATHIFTSSDAPERPQKRRRESPGETSEQQNNSVGRDIHRKEVPRKDESPPKRRPSQRADNESPKPINLASRPTSQGSHSVTNREPATPNSGPKNSIPSNPGSNDSEGSYFGTLRISSQKPRKKLMYSALLPQTGSQGSSQKRPKPASNLDSSVGLQNAQIEHRSYPTEIGGLSDLIDGFSSDDFPDAAIPPYVANSDLINESPSGSTILAFTDLMTAEGSPTPQIRPRPNSSHAPEPPPPQEPQKQVAKRTSPDHKGISELETVGTPIPPQVTTKQSRQLLRSHSEFGAPGRRSPAKFPSSPPMPPQREQPIASRNAEVNRANAEQSPTEMSAARIFQRSVSDLNSLRLQNGKHPHAIVATGKKHPAPILEEEEEDDQGPWTSEALDLFDWWPPGKPKPAAKPVGI